MGSKGFYAHDQNRENWGELVWPNCVGKLGWVKWGMLELACPTACTCLFKVRPGVLSKILSHLWGKVNLPLFLFNMGNINPNKIDSLLKNRSF